MPVTDGQDRENQEINDGRLEKDNQMEVTE